MRLITSLSTGLLLLLASKICIATPPKTLSLGVVPQQAAVKLAKKWVPFANYLSKASGSKVSFTTAPDIPTFEQRLGQQAYDIAYMNPYHYVTFHKQSQYMALAKAKDKKIKGILVVRKDSNYQQLQDLKGLTLAFPSPLAFAASMLPRANLTAAKVAFTPKYVSSHDSVYENVAKGILPAGGGVMRTFKTSKPATTDKLRIMWTSKGYTPHAFATSPQVDEATRQKLLQALLKMDQDPQGLKVLQELKLKGLVAGQNSDWNDVRELKQSL
ncbi:MAG: phosphate/phosphite/phosphonate ABC transporter substrate-binding protein [Zetaproteobacteria bacterium]|nr:phosphate/phosphite/phosphonate ABC transporter substrate-binding protein [Zetaproteobacteria bacterium]